MLKRVRSGIREVHMSRTLRGSMIAIERGEGFLLLTSSSEEQLLLWKVCLIKKKALGSRWKRWSAKAWNKLHVPPFSFMKLWILHLNYIFHLNFRFSIQSLFDLKTVFSALGIRDAFDPTTANFKGISGKRLEWIQSDNWPNTYRLWDNIEEIRQTQVSFIDCTSFSVNSKTEFPFNQSTLLLIIAIGMDGLGRM